MKKIAVLLADGFEEIEALTVVDVLRRAGFECDMVSITSNLNIRSAHNVVVQADVAMGDLNYYDMIVLPGGSIGAENLSKNDDVLDYINQFLVDGKYVAAICASPAVVLSKVPAANGKRITSYPGMQGFLGKCKYVNEIVVQDENLITSRGPATTLAFAYKLVEVLGKDSLDLQEGMLYNLIK